MISIVGVTDRFGIKVRAKIRADHGRQSVIGAVGCTEKVMDHRIKMTRQEVGLGTIHAGSFPHQQDTQTD